MNEFSTERINHEFRSYRGLQHAQAEHVTRLKQVLDQTTADPEVRTLLELVIMGEIMLINVADKIQWRLERFQMSYDQMWANITEILNMTDENGGDTSAVREQLAHLAPVFRARPVLRSLTDDPFGARAP